MSEKETHSSKNKKSSKTKQKKQSDYDYYSDYSEYYYSEYSDYSEKQKKPTVRASRPLKTTKEPAKNINKVKNIETEVPNKVTDQEKMSINSQVRMDDVQDKQTNRKIEENDQINTNEVITEKEKNEENQNSEVNKNKISEENQSYDITKNNCNQSEADKKEEIAEANAQNVLNETKMETNKNVIITEQTMQPRAQLQNYLVIEQAQNIQQPLVESENVPKQESEIIIQVREPEPKPIEPKEPAPAIKRSVRHSNAFFNKEFKPEPPQRPSSSRRSKSSKKDHSIPMPQRLLPIRTKALKHKHISNLKDADWDATVYYMEVERAQCLQECNYELSVQLSNAINFVIACKDAERKANDRENAIKGAKEKLQSIEEEIEKFNEETKELEKGLKENRENERQKLQETHTYNLDVLDEEWASPNKIRMFNHPSGRLLSMRKQLFHLVSQNRYEEASKLKRFIDEEQRNEEAKSMEVMQNAYDQAVIKLLTKNARELKEFDTQTAIELSKLKEQRNTEKRPLVIRLRQAKEKIEQLTGPEARNSTKAYGSIRKQRRNMFLSREKAQESKPKETVFDVEAVPLLYLPKFSRRVSERSAIRMVKEQNQ